MDLLNGGAGGSLFRHGITLFLIVAGALTAYFTLVNSIYREIDALRSDVAVQAKQLETFDGMRNQFAETRHMSQAHSVRLDGLADWLATVSRREDQIPSRLATIEAKLDDIRARFGRMSDRIDGMDRRLRGQKTARENR